MFDRLALLKNQVYKKLKGAQVTTPSFSCLKFQWRRKKDEEREDPEVHTVQVITERSKHPVEL